MTTYRICRYCGDLHDIASWPANHMDPQPARSVLPAPYTISDTMEAGVQSMADGKIYTSKSAIRRHYRQAGMIEVGNDPARNRRPPKPKPDRRAIKTAVEKAAARVARGDVREHMKIKL